MSLAGILVLAVLPIIVVVAAYLVSRMLFKIIMAIATIAFIATLVVGAYVLYDAYGFTHDLNEGPTRFVLPDRSAGIETINATRVPLNASELASNTSRTTFTVPLSFISHNATASYLDTNATYTESIAAMRSSDPASSFASALANASAQGSQRASLETQMRTDIANHYPTATEQRSYLFGELLSSTLRIEGDQALILGIRNGTIGVEPNRPVITFIRRTPAWITKEALSVQVH